MKKSIRTKIAAIIIVLIILLSLSAGVCSSGQINISLSDGQDVMPGSFATIVAHIFNQDDAKEALIAELITPEGWDILPYGKEILIEPKKVEALFFTLQIPHTELADTYPIFLKLISTESGEEYSAEGYITVLENRRLDIIADTGFSFYPGESGYHAFIIRNSGNRKEELSIEISSLPGWEIEVHSSSIVLNPGESLETGCGFTIPKNEKPGVKNCLSIIAKTSDREVQQSVVLSLVVLPPTPESIPPLSPDSIPAIFTVSAGGVSGNMLQDIDMSLRAYGSVVDDVHIDLRSRLRSEEEWDDYDGNMGLIYQKGPFTFEFGLDSNVERWSDNFFRIRYEVENWAITLGDLSMGLTPLVNAIGRGVAFSIFEGEQEFSMLAFDRSLGVTIANRFETAAYRLLYLRDWKTDRDIFSAYGEHRLSDEMSVNGEFALIDDSISFSSGAAYNNSSLFINGRYFLYGEGLNYMPEGRNGFELSVVSKMHYLPLRLSYSNIIDRASYFDDRLIRRKHASLYTDIPLGPFKLMAAIGGNEEKSLKSSAGQHKKDKRYWASEIAIEQTIGDWFWRLGAGLESEYDIEHDIRTAWVSYAPAIGYRWNDASFSIGYGLFGTGESIGEAKKNLSLTAIADFTYDPESGPFDYLNFRYYNSDISMLSIRGKLDLNKDKSISLTGRARAYFKEGRPDWIYRVGLTTRFDLPVPGAYSKGKIKGRVFFEENQAGAERLILMIGKNEVSTDKDGFFEFPPLPASEYKIEFKDLPFNYELLTDMPMTVELAAGATEIIVIPIKRVSQISGHVIYDPSVGKTSPFGIVTRPRSIAGALIELRQDGTMIESVRTNSDGYYQFTSLVDGEYEIKLITETLPERLDVASPNPVVITIKPEENRRIDFTVGEKILDIEITFDAEV